MINDPVFRKQYQVIYGSVTIIKNILLIIGIWVHHNNDADIQIAQIQPNVDLETFNPFTYKNLDNT